MMLEKPFYSSMTIIILLPLLIFCLAIAWIYFFGIETLNEKHGIDGLFHVVGGVSISFSAAGVSWHLVCQKIIDLQDINLFRLFVFGFVCFTVISWEIFEYILPIDPEYLINSYSDTIIDMICGMIGGLLGVFFILRRSVQM